MQPTRDQPFGPSRDRRRRALARSAVLGVLLAGGAGPMAAQTADPPRDPRLEARARLLARGAVTSEEAILAPAPALPPQDEVTAHFTRALGDLRMALAGGDASRAQLIETIDGLRAADLALVARFEAVASRLAEIGAGPEVLARLAAARSRHEERLAAFRALGDAAELRAPGAAAAEALAARLRAALPLDAEPPTPEILRALALPFVRPDWAARAPVLTPAIQPAYARPVEVVAVPEDLSASRLAPLSEPILLQAEALGYEPVRIYEFVRNEIETEAYAGASQDAELTLARRRGNDADQASLLIALLRAAGQPARYVSGVVERSLADLADELALPTAAPDLVANALRRAGIANRAVVRGGRIAAFEVEHTWVESQVPYANYRGAVVDASGPTWVPLAPAIARHDGAPSRAVLAEMIAAGAIDLDAEVEEFLSTPQPEGLLDRLRRRVDAYLEAQGESPSDGLGARQRVAEHLGLLPSTLPFRVVAVTAEGADLPAARQVQARLTLRGGAAETDPVVFEWQGPVAALAGRRISLSYLPATVDDQTVTAAFGGLHGVPLYLIQLRAQLKVDGRPWGTGAPLEAGRRHRLEIALDGPAGSQALSRDLVAGGYYVLTLGAGSAAPSDEEPVDRADTESRAARLMQQVAVDYGARWEAAEDELAALLGVAALRPMPPVVIVGGAVDVLEVLGLPEQLRWNGLTLDAALRSAEPVGSDDVGRRQWFSLAALEGSSLEGRIFEELFLVESLSADEGLARARAAGLEIVTLDSSSPPAALASLPFSPALVAELARWVDLGYRVEVPRGPITVQAWTGVVWRVTAPDGAGAGYFLAGGFAGGTTTVPPANWALSFLAELLAAPYSAEPNPNPAAAAEVVKIAATDGQRGTAGGDLASPLKVLVRDATGRPVLGALVTFYAAGGGGHVLDSGLELTESTVRTNGLGVAEVRYRLGPFTDLDPVYLLLHAGDEHSTRAGVNTVEVQVDSAAGVRVTDGPFTALGLPGRLARLALLSTPPNGPNELPGTWVDTVRVQPQDFFGNPLSNVPVRFTVAPMTSEWLGQCQGFSRLQDAVLFVPEADASGRFPDCGGLPPVESSHCGHVELTRNSSASGTAAGVILGNSPIHTYHVVARVGGQPPVQVDYPMQFLRGTGPDGSPLCSPFLQASYLAVQETDELGNVVSATAPGSVYGGTVGVTLLLGAPNHALKFDISSSDFVLADASVDWSYTPVTGAVRFTLDTPGSVSPAVFDPRTHLYSTTVTTATLPGPNVVRFEASGLEMVRSYDNWETHLPEDVVIRADAPLAGVVTQVWGVDPWIRGYQPDPLPVGDGGRTTAPSTIHYGIDPPAYRARSVEIDFLSDGERVATAVGSSRQVEGEVSIQRGYTFDTSREQDVVVVLNRGTASEMETLPDELPIFQPILRRTGSFRPGSTLTLRQDVDVVNGRVCEIGAEVTYGVNQPSTVRLEMHQIDALEAGSNAPLFGQTITLIADEHREPGDYSHRVSPADLAPGDFEYLLTATSDVDGHVDVLRGTARVDFRSWDSLPVGHTLVHGVDVATGHLTVQREDLGYPGRGPALHLARSYGSQAGFEAGALGVGWQHSYESRVVVTPCGEVIVVGGEGGGMRFVADGAGGLRPLKGYHGTLVANAATRTFDFYSTGGTRYRYGQAFRQEVYLDSITDPNGNTTTLVYQRTGPEGRPSLRSVVDGAGRTLTFQYETRRFRLAEGETEVLVRVEGPAGSGQSVDFAYDVWGNLVRAAREAGARIESYRYADTATAGLEVRHRLVATRDELRGAEVGYSFLAGSLAVTAEHSVGAVLYTGVTLPEGGTSQFDFDLAALADPSSTERTTRVTDSRGAVTSYAVDRYGSPLEIVDPTGARTRMTWLADDVLLASRTEANGTLTRYEYDPAGNPTLEETVYLDPDGNARTVRRTHVYAPVDAFAPPFVIKNREVATVDGNGVEMRSGYDARGNRLYEEVTVHDIDGSSRLERTIHTYFANGDRATTTDPRGEVVRFSYDRFGDVVEAIDPEGGRTVSTFDVRGLETSRTDALGRTTRMTYDSLGRPLRRELPKVAGESVPPAETWSYEDAVGRTVKRDALDRAVTLDSDRENRPIRMENGAGGVQLVAYDTEGNKTSESRWFDATTPRVDTAFEYDLAGRLVRREEPEGRTTTFAYDEVGNLVRETLSDRRPGSTFVPRITEHDYDGLGRRMATRRLGLAAPVETTARYDDEGREVQSTDALGRTTHTRRDERGRVIEVSGPAGTRQRRLYDAAGHVVEERVLQFVTGTDELESVRQVAYDGRGLPVRQVDATGGVTLLEYDAVGNLVRQIDPLLHVESYAYDERDRRILRRQHLDRVTVPATEVDWRFGYDAAGQLTTETWPNGNRITHEYDGAGRRTASADALGSLGTTRYDAAGNVVEQADNLGRRTLTTYDGLDRPVRREEPADRVTLWSYDAAGNRITETNPRGHVTRFEFDALDRRIAAVTPAPFEDRNEWTYDAVGNVLSESDRRGFATTSEYDEADRRVRLVAPAPFGFEQTFAYDRAGNLLAETDRRGTETSHRYDRENRRTETSKAGVVLEAVEYDAAGNRRFVTDANGNTIGFEYDERNLLVAENRPLAAITRHTRDAQGDVTRIRDAEGRETSFELDPRRRVVAVIDPLGHRTETTFDLAGNQISRRRPQGNTWSFEYDDLNRLVAVLDPSSGLASYAYDANGNLASQTDALGRTTSFTYDELDRRRRRTYPDGAFERFEYDPDGRLAATVDALGQRMEWSYDALGRESERRYPVPADGGTGDHLVSVATTYDPNGNPIQVVETYSGGTGTRTTERAYDAFDRLERVVDPHGETLLYGYDPNGNRVRLTDSDAKVTVTTFDALNRPVAVNVAGAGVTEYGYLRDGRLRTVRYPNGTVTTQSYDGAGRLATIEHRLGSQTLSRYLYAYDANDNRTEQQEDNGAGLETTTYGFDTLDRLERVQYPTETVTYGYDAVGNRRAEEHRSAAGVTADYHSTFDVRDRLLERADALDPLATITFTYDANGNQLSKTEHGAATTFRYDTRNQMIEVRTDGTLTGSFLYDFQGLRVEKRVGTGSTVRYVYDDRSVLQTTDLAGQTLSKYDYGPDRLLSLTHGGEGRRFYLFDGLRSVIGLTDSAGSITFRASYDAWGTERRRSGSSANLFGFTSHELDLETGLYYARARYYDPRFGQFLTEDPELGDPRNPPSLHRYLYAFSNPTVYVDPTGRKGEEVSFWQSLKASYDEGGVLAVFDNLQGRLSGKKTEILEKLPEKETPSTAGGTYDEASVAGLEVGGLQLTEQGLDTLELALKLGSLSVGDSKSNLSQATEQDIKDALQRARERLAQLRVTIAEDPEAMSKIYAKPDEIVLNLLRSGVETAGALTGDNPRVCAQATGDLTQLGVNLIASELAAAKLGEALEALDSVGNGAAFRRAQALRRAERASAEAKAAVESAGNGAGAPGDVPKGGTTALQPFYPPNSGFLGKTSRMFLYAGERIDRYGGSAASRFFSPAGTPAAARALPPGTANQPLRTFEVVKPFEVEAGTVAPAFGQLGLGTQYRTPVPLEVLLKRGILREVTP